MLKVAILDDYQNVSQEFVDLKKLSGKYEFKIFSEPFLDEADAIEQLSDFEALLIMRERTPISKNLIDNLNDLKYIITSGVRNKSVDLEAAKKRKIIVCGTESNTNPTCELTWALILGLSRNLKTEIDNMYQGYWQTTVGFELKGKIIGLIGLGKVGSQVAKIANAFGMQVMAWSENLDLDKCKELNVLPCSKEDLIKTSDYQIDIGIINAKFVWYNAVFAIVIGHIFAVYIGHRIATKIFTDQGAAIRSQYPMMVLMIGYTMLSLWILSQPIVE